MAAETVLLRLASALPASLCAFATAALAVRVLRIREPRLCVALWLLAAAESVLAVAGTSASSLFFVRLVVPPAVAERIAPAAPAALAVWGAVAAALLVRRGVAAHRLGAAAAALHALHPARLRDGPRVRVAAPPGDGTPFVAGVLRPVLVVPRGFWGRLGPAERAATLAHETAHLRRRDPLVRCVVEAAADALWFALPLRWIVRRLEEAVECAADAAAVRRGASRPSLVRAVLASVDGAAAPRPAWGFRGVPGALVRRIDRLRRPASRRAVAAQVVVLAAVAGPPRAAASEVVPGDAPAGRVAVGARLAPWWPIPVPREARDR